MKKSLWMIAIVGAFSCLAKSSLASTTCTATLLINGDPVRSFSISDVSEENARARARAECEGARTSAVIDHPWVVPSHYTCESRECHED